MQIKGPEQLNEMNWAITKIWWIWEKKIKEIKKRYNTWEKKQLSSEKMWENGCSTRQTRAIS